MNRIMNGKKRTCIISLGIGMYRVFWYLSYLSNSQKESSSSSTSTSSHSGSTYRKQLGDVVGFGHISKPIPGPAKFRHHYYRDCLNIVRRPVRCSWKQAHEYHLTGLDKIGILLVKYYNDFFVGFAFCTEKATLS